MHIGSIINFFEAQFKTILRTRSYSCLLVFPSLFRALSPPWKCLWEAPSDPSKKKPLVTCVALV
jgi:hypothetical protein